VSAITRTRRSFWLAHTATSVVAVGLQVAGVYAAVVTFGVLVTGGIYVVGGLVAFLQHVAAERVRP
jgi:hypothetical protein